MAKYNFDAFKFLDERYSSKDRACLLKLQNSLKGPDGSPLKSQSFLHCIPLFKNTLCMVECAAHTGADLFVTSPSRQPFDRFCVEILKKAGITFIEPGTARGDFDFVIDTAADLIDSVRAKKCLVEDTRSGSFLYEAKAKDNALNLAPIVSFDESRLKQIEDLSVLTVKNEKGVVLKDLKSRTGDQPLNAVIQSKGFDTVPVNDSGLVDISPNALSVHDNQIRFFAKGVENPLCDFRIVQRGSDYGLMEYEVIEPQLADSKVFVSRVDVDLP